MFESNFISRQDVPRNAWGGSIRVDHGKGFSLEEHSTEIMGGPAEKARINRIVQGEQPRERGGLKGKKRGSPKLASKRCLRTMNSMRERCRGFLNVQKREMRYGKLESGDGTRSLYPVKLMPGHRQNGSRRGKQMRKRDWGKNRNYRKR